MSPAVPGSRTILLIPHEGDIAAMLLADEAGGGRVPWARQTWREDYGSPDGGTWSEEWTVGDVDTSHEPAPRTGLLLVHEGVQVALSHDRARRVLAVHLGLDTRGGVILTSERPKGAKRWAWLLEDWNGERVVLDPLSNEPDPSMFLAGYGAARGLWRVEMLTVEAA